MAPADHLANVSSGAVALPPEGYNIADHLLDVASDPPAALFQHAYSQSVGQDLDGLVATNGSAATSVGENEKNGPLHSTDQLEKGNNHTLGREKWWKIGANGAPGYMATFLTQFEVLAAREWKVLRRYV